MKIKNKQQMRRFILIWFFIILVCASVVTMALPKNPPVKKYKVEQTVEWWSHTLNVLEAAKTQLKQSDLPSKQVVYLSDSLLTPIQIEMTKQIQDQLNAEIKKDTTKPKNN